MNNKGIFWVFLFALIAFIGIWVLIILDSDVVVKSGLLLYSLAFVVIALTVSFKILRHASFKFILTFFLFFIAVFMVFFGLIWRYVDGLHLNYSDRGLIICFVGLALLIILLCIQLIKVAFFWKEPN